MSLTPRQLDIITRLASGRSVLQIADDLYLSDNSIKTHIKNARRTVGAPTQAALIAWARERGLVA